mgnify:CR=1 FL=1
MSEEYFQQDIGWRIRSSKGENLSPSEGCSKILENSDYTIMDTIQLMVDYSDQVQWTTALI